VSPAKTVQQFNQAHDCLASSVLAPGRLFDLTSQKWTELANLSISCSTWSRDGQYLYFQTLNVKDPAVYRLAVKNQTTERLFSINIRLADATIALVEWPRPRWFCFPLTRSNHRRNLRFGLPVSVKGTKPAYLVLAWSFGSHAMGKNGREIGSPLATIVVGLDHRNRAVGLAS
jgi:hypothetical protein